MARIAEQTEEDEAAGDRGIQAAEEDERGYHEGKRNLLVQVLQRAKSRGSHVVVANKDVHDSANNTKDNDFGNGASPQRLGKLAIKC